MKTRLAISSIILGTVALAVVLPAEAHLFHRFAGVHGAAYCEEGSSGQAAPASGAPYAGGWQDGYYDVAWGMPMAVVVPPTARWQTDYSWGASSARISHIDARFQPQYPGPESAYQMGNYLPAPPQPSDTRQMGDYYVRGPRR